MVKDVAKRRKENVGEGWRRNMKRKRTSSFQGRYLSPKYHFTSARPDLLLTSEQTLSRTTDRLQPNCWNMPPVKYPWSLPTWNGSGNFKESMEENIFTLRMILATLPGTISIVLSIPSLTWESLPGSNRSNGQAYLIFSHPSFQIQNDLKTTQSL